MINCHTWVILSFHFFFCYIYVDFKAISSFTKYIKKKSGSHMHSICVGHFATFSKCLWWFLTVNSGFFWCNWISIGNSFFSQRHTWHIGTSGCPFLFVIFSLNLFQTNTSIYLFFISYPFFLFQKVYWFGIFLNFILL